MIQIASFVSSLVGVLVSCTAFAAAPLVVDLWRPAEPGHVWESDGTGTYTIDHTLLFEPADSGTAEHDVIYRAAPNESPTYGK